MQSQYLERDRTSTPVLSLALGCFSIALGAAELLAPRRVARLIGVPADDVTTNVLRAYGARELATGIGIFVAPSDPTWLWSRVGGDALDLASLGVAASDERSARAPLSLAAMAVLGVTVLDVFAASRHPRTSETSRRPRLNEQATTVKSPIEDAEAAWIEWCESGGSKLKGDYVVRFELAPGARGTEIHLAGNIARGKLREELRHFKQFVEAGEITVSDGPGLWRPAQPRRAPGSTIDPAEVRR